MSIYRPTDPNQWMFHQLHPNLSNIRRMPSNSPASEEEIFTSLGYRLEVKSQGDVDEIFTESGSVARLVAAISEPCIAGTMLDVDIHFKDNPQRIRVAIVKNNNSISVLTPDFAHRIFKDSNSLAKEIQNGSLFYLSQEISRKVLESTLDCDQRLIKQFKDLFPFSDSAPVSTSQYSLSSYLYPQNPFKKWRFCLSEGINLKYSPFNQAVSLTGPINEEGACHILSYTWLCKKLQQEDLSSPAIYRVDKLELPHPVITGTNPDIADETRADFDVLRRAIEKASITSQEIESISTDALKKITQQQELNPIILKDNFRKFNRAPNPHVVYPVEPFDKVSKEHFENIAKILELPLEKANMDLIHKIYFLTCRQHFAACISFGLDFRNSSTAHSVAFIKRGNHCAFFEPNYGEKTFKTTEEFIKWFYHEVESGVLWGLQSEGVFNQKKGGREYIPIFELDGAIQLSQFEEKEKDKLFSEAKSTETSSTDKINSENNEEEIGVKKLTSCEIKGYIFRESGKVDITLPDTVQFV